MAALLALQGGSTWLALAGVAIINLVVQPVAFWFCLNGVHKLALGLLGKVSYAMRRVPESELADLSPRMRRLLPWYCVLQGIITLALGAAMASGCFGILVQMIRS